VRNGIGARNHLKINETIIHHIDLDPVAYRIMRTAGSKDIRAWKILAFGFKSGISCTAILFAMGTSKIKVHWFKI
jgi:hypothetical protein